MSSNCSAPMPILSVAVLSRHVVPCLLVDSQDRHQLWFARLQTELLPERSADVLRTRLGVIELLCAATLYVCAHINTKYPERTALNAGFDLDQLAEYVARLADPATSGSAGPAGMTITPYVTRLRAAVGQNHAHQLELWEHTFLLIHNFRKGKPLPAPVAERLLGAERSTLELPTDSPGPGRSWRPLRCRSRACPTHNPIGTPAKIVGWRSIPDTRVENREAKHMSLPAGMEERVVIHGMRWPRPKFSFKEVSEELEKERSRPRTSLPSIQHMFDAEVVGTVTRNLYSIW